MRNRRSSAHVVETDAMEEFTPAPPFAADAEFDARTRSAAFGSHLDQQANTSSGRSTETGRFRCDAAFEVVAAGTWPMSSREVAEGHLLRWVVGAEREANLAWLPMLFGHQRTARFRLQDHG